MMHIFLLSMLMFSTFMRADTLGEYTQLVDRVYEIVRDVRQAVPAHKWPARFDEICRCMQKDIVPCSSLRYLVEQCRTLACCPEHKLDHLKKPIEDCWQMLASMPYDVPQLSAQELETYRSCCKRYKCVFVSGSLSVGGTATINNLDVTGLAHFFNTPVGPILSYAFLFSDGESGESIENNAAVNFNTDSLTSRFISSPEFALNPVSLTVSDGIIAPAGKYIFGWTALVIAPAGAAPTIFELQQNNNTIAGSQHTILSANSSIDYTQDLVGFGVVELTSPATIKLVNTSGAQRSLQSTAATNALIVLIRIQS